MGMQMRLRLVARDPCSCPGRLVAITGPHFHARAADGLTFKPGCIAPCSADTAALCKGSVRILGRSGSGAAAPHVLLRRHRRWQPHRCLLGVQLQNQKGCMFVDCIPQKQPS